MAGAESQYPEKFQPEILYQDTDLIAKHAQAARERASAEQAKRSQVTTPAATTEQARPGVAVSKPENPLMENYPIGLFALALAGFVFWNIKRSGSKVQEIQIVSTAPSAGTPGETGVARYMESLGVSEKVTAVETGVTRYVKSLPTKVATVETGVSRYLKNISAR